MSDQLDRTIAAISVTLMRSVIASGVMTGHTDHDRACRIMREELKALLCADEDRDSKYADERAAVRANWLGDGMAAIAMSNVALECVSRIHAERVAAL